MAPLFCDLAPRRVDHPEAFVRQPQMSEHSQQATHRPSLRSAVVAATSFQAPYGRPSHR